MDITNHYSKSRRSRNRAVLWMGVFTLLLSLMSPLISLSDVSAAQDDGDDLQCGPGFVVDEYSGECVPEEQDCPDGEVWDGDMGQCAPDPNAVQDEQAPIGIQIEKYDCPASPDSGNWGYDDLQNECSSNQNPVQFTHGGDGISESSNQVEGYTEWLGDAPGNHYVYENIPSGYGQPRVFCGVYVPEQSQPSPSEASVQNGNTVGWNLNEGEYVYCQWFNIQSGYGTVHITKYDCSSYAADPTSASYDDLREECDSPMSGVEFQLYQGQSQVDSGSTSGSGEVTWDQAPTGSITIAEVLPPSYEYALVYCTYYAESGGSPGDYQSVSVQEGFYHGWELEEGYVLDCYWFNFGGTSTTDATGTNWFDLYKYVCAYDTPYDADYDYYLENCDAYPNWEFSLEYEGGGSSQSTDDSGYTGWDSVPQGDWRVSESLPEGYGDPIVWCRYVEWPDEASYDNNWELYEASGGSWGDSFAYDDLRFECYVFNIQPEDTDGSYIDFYKYVCDYDLPTDSGIEYYFEQCSPQQGWDFDVQWEGGGSSQTTDGEGKASWAGVPTGEWTASETLPDGYGQPLTWCRFVEWPDDANYDNNWFPYDPSGGEITYTFDYDNLRLECYWFNFAPQNDYNQVDFYKYVCDYDLDKDGGLDYYRDSCELVPGWEFDLSWDGGGEAKTTDDSGLASWSGVPTGEWDGSETLPEGYGDPLVWCQYVEWPDDVDMQSTPESYDATGGQIAGSFEYDEMRIECFWFNFAPEGGNTIQFYKMWCSDEATYDSSFDDLREYCEFGDQPASVSLSYGSSSSSMDASGQSPAEWSGVPTGEWTAEETQYDGWSAPIIWCQYVQWPDTYTDVTDEPFLLSSGEWQGTWDNQYDNVTIACVIFNLPYEQNWIELTKWWCADDLAQPAEQSVDYLYQECERGTENTMFQLQHRGGTVDGATDSEGNIEWGDLPGGDWVVSETLTEGYGDPVVWCSWVTWPESADVTDEPLAYSAPNGTFNGTFEWGGMRIHCDIFNIPYYDPGTITIFKWSCPTGVPTDSNAEYLRDECYLVTTGMDFSLAYGDVNQPQTTDSAGTATWEDIPQGEWTLSETSTSGYGSPVVYCQWVDWSSAPEGEYNGDLFAPLVTGSSFTGSHEYPGMDLSCYIFNFEDEPTDNWVIFYKYYCEPGSTWSALDEWIENCSAGADGSSFTLQNEQGSYPKTTTGGTAEWSGVSDGAFTVQESLPSGYENPVVWCYYGTYDSESSTMRPLSADFSQMESPDGAWEGEFDGELNRFYCYVFNIPGTDNTITVYKYNCEYRPVGYNTLWQWQEACDTPAHGIGFTLTNDDGSDSKDTDNGIVEWADVPEGEFTLQEEPTAGYGEAVWWCGWSAYYEGLVYDAFPSQQPAPGNIYSGEITVPGTAWFCYVFNIPDDESTIVVYKYNCPEADTSYDSLQGYQEGCTEYGDGIEFSLDNVNGTSTKEISGGSATWYDVPQGEFTLTENVPEGYGDAIWWCGFTGYENGAVADGFPQQVEAPDGVFSSSIEFDQTYYFCWVFNFPDYDREVTVYKWYCPEGLQPESEDYQDWADTCTTKMTGVGFNLSSDSWSSNRATNASGWITWYGVEPDSYTLTEKPLPGYEQPWVFCSLEAAYEDGAAYAEDFTPYTVTDRSVSKDLSDYNEYQWICHVFNIPKGPGEITVYKWYCPAGYDVSAWGANPEEDCTEAYDDVEFVLDQPVGPNVSATTGDAGPGSVYFGDLDPGSYVLTEQVPPGIVQAFVWDCYGANIPAVHPTPLTWGNVLNVDVAGGDSIVCNWYNIPTPDNGWVTLYKYQCSTKTFTSDVDCDTYEFGATFELTADGGASQGEGTTNAGGNYTWSDLDAGNYILDEKDGTPCKITSTNVTADGKVVVEDGEGTIVKVYNCASKPPGGGEKPPPGGKVPGKYPNTGMGDQPQGPVALPQDDGDDEDVIAPDGGTPSAEDAAAEFYTISCLNVTAGAGQNPSTSPETDEADEPEDGGLPPFLQDAPADEPVATEAPSTDDESTDDSATVEDCERGSVPQKITIDVAGVNHDIEILEILDGVMEAPTGPNVVSWYKETARLGEESNIVIAGHLNWWGVPEGPFYNLTTMQEGDRIEITGEDGNTYVYEVQWVEQESNLDAPRAEVVGPTGEQSLTLITCGGEWDASISEYNERTVVRAVQVDMIEAESPDTGDADDQAALPAPIAMYPSTRFWSLAA